jgi:TPR repeat protein
MCFLANTLSWGAPGVPEDAARAKSLYERVIEFGRDGSTVKADAIWGLACLVQQGAPGVGLAEEETATSLFSQLVESWNDVQAMVRLGDMAASKRDFERAYRFYRQASEAECVAHQDKESQSEACFNMAAMLYRGSGPFPCDESRAFHMFEKAFALGHTGALERLAGMYLLGVTDMAGNVVVDSDVEKAKEMYSQAMEEYGDRSAMHCLAHILRTEDKVRTSKIYQRLIDEFEDSSAMTSLGLMYERGDDCCPHDGSIPQDAVKAVELYERAIALGDTEAMWNLGA